MTAARASLVTGTVHHRRLRPAAHEFETGTYCLLLPMRSLRAQPDPALVRNRFGWLSFHEGDDIEGELRRIEDSGWDCLD